MVATATVAAVPLVTAGVAQADQICNVVGDTPVYRVTDGAWTYTIADGGGFRVYANWTDGWIEGNGNGHQVGLARLSHMGSCHTV